MSDNMTKKNLSPQNKPKKGKWKVAACIILILELLGIAAAMITLAMLNLLPMLYFVGVAAILLLLLLISYKLLFAGRKKKKDGEASPEEEKKRKRGLTVKRTFGSILAAIVLIVCILIVTISIQGMSVMTAVGTDDPETVTVENMVGVYVRAADEAQAISDVTGDAMGYSESYEADQIKKTLTAIEKETNAALNKVSYDTVHDMAAALYDSSVRSVVLSTAYVEILEDQEEFENFSEDTRMIYSYTVKTRETVKRRSTKDEAKETFVVYISGSDTRSRTLSKSRSDVNILAVVNPKTHQVLLINTPRDFYVPISISSGSKDKLTHCGIYGIECSMDTLGNLYGVDVDHYAQINFTGFETLIDAIGGVDVYSEKTFRTREGRYQVYEGENHMSGAVALAFCRDRYAFSDGDNARGRHQMAVIAAIIDKLSASTILSSYSDILKSIEGMFTTDFTSSEMSSLVKLQLKDGAKWNVKNYAVTGTGGKDYTYSVPNKKAYVTYPDQSTIDFAKGLIKKVQDGKKLTDEDLKASSSDSE